MSKKSTPFLERIARNLGSLFVIAFVLAAIVLASTSWVPGTAPQAAPGSGNVELLTGPWLENGSNISYTTGNVGIGTTTPGTKLEVTGGAIKATGGLILETRTSDPASPTTGQIWLRTDI